jgi:hypothetical protein
VERFILEQNIVRFRELLTQKISETERHTIQLLLSAAALELAYLQRADATRSIRTQLSVCDEVR